MTLNPAQMDTLEHLRGELPRAEYPLALRSAIRDRMTDELEAVLGTTTKNLLVSKHMLGQVTGCEAKFAAERDVPFTWTPMAARGVVAHKALEYHGNWRDPASPRELVDAALERLTDSEDRVATWLRNCSPSELAELTGMATEVVTKFTETFPPLQRSWIPVTETGLRIELCDRRVTLQGRVDLTLGQPDGTRAGKVLVDFKTGGSYRSHVDDLRFYALCETMRLGVPPARLATAYLDSGEIHAEDVDMDVLEAAIRRTVDGVQRLVELNEGRDPQRSPGPGCWRCPLADDCQPGRQYRSTQ